MQEGLKTDRAGCIWVKIGEVCVISRSWRLRLNSGQEG